MKGDKPNSRFHAAQLLLSLLVPLLMLSGSMYGQERKGMQPRSAFGGESKVFRNPGTGTSTPQSVGGGSRITGGDWIVENPSCTGSDYNTGVHFRVASHQSDWCDNHYRLWMSADNIDWSNVTGSVPEDASSGGWEGTICLPVGPSRQRWWKNEQWWDGSFCDDDAWEGNYFTTSTVGTKAPINLVVVPLTDKTALLRWQKGTDHPNDKHSYYIYKNNVYVATVLGTSGNASTYEWQFTLPAGETARWEVATHSYPGGTESNKVLVEGGPNQFYVPYALTIHETMSVSSGDTIRGKILSWSDSSEYASQHRIYRDGILICAIDKAATQYSTASYTDLDVGPLPHYYEYCVRNYNGLSNRESGSAWPDALAGWILPQATNGKYTNRVEIAWESQSGLADAVKIFRDDAELGVVVPEANAYYDYDALPGKLYSYFVESIQGGVVRRRARTFGFMRGNGRIEGKVQTTSGIGVRDVELTAERKNDLSLKAALFNGSDSRVDGMLQYPGIKNSFTMEIWVKPAAARDYTDQSTAGVAGQAGQRYAIAPVDGQRFYGSLSHTGAGISVGTNGISVFEMTGGSYMPSLLVKDLTLDSTVWSHVAVVFRDGKPTLFVNGDSVAQGIKTTKTVHPSALMGKAGTYGPYRGSLDEARIWDRELTQKQIKSRMRQQLAGSDSGLAGYWNFNRYTITDERIGDATYNGGHHGRPTHVTFSTDVPDARSRAFSDLSGHYSISGLSIDEASEFDISARKTKHEFRVPTLSRMLDIAEPVASGVDFTDITAFGIEGTIGFVANPRPARHFLRWSGRAGQRRGQRSKDRQHRYVRVRCGRIRRIHL
ncbi:MAG: LamG domain-containing protein [Ignavibacteria bacterium]|nr:LamG domain-containing protein [Ignavibacteria bacterium]